MKILCSLSSWQSFGGVWRGGAESLQFIDWCVVCLDVYINVSPLSVTPIPPMIVGCYSVRVVNWSEPGAKTCVSL